MPLVENANHYSLSADKLFSRSSIRRDDVLTNERAQGHLGLSRLRRQRPFRRPVIGRVSWSFNVIRRVILLPDYFVVHTPAKLDQVQVGPSG